MTRRPTVLSIVRRVFPACARAWKRIRRQS